MTAEQYTRWTKPFRGKELLVQKLNRMLTDLGWLMYPVLLAALVLNRDPRLLRCILVPGVSFVIVTLVRRWINAPRPYEALDIDPIIHKDTKGQSMPSRHVFSIFVIAMTYLWVWPVMGVLLLVLSVVMAGLRVIGGVHFPRDVLVGALCGIVSALVGYWLI